MPGRAPLGILRALVGSKPSAPTRKPRSLPSGLDTAGAVFCWPVATNRQVAG